MRYTNLLLIILTLSFILVGPASAQLDTLPFVVKIDHLEEVFQGTYVTVNVTLENAPLDVAGFDFTIATDPNALFFQEATPGEQFFGSNNCDWEYFKYDVSQHDACYPNKDNCQPGTIQFVGIANFSNSGHPNCNLPDSIPATLFSMKYLVTNDRTFECVAAPIRFFWGTCADNTFATINGQLVISLQVFDVMENGNLINITDPYNSPFPTFQGAQFGECNPGGPPPAPISQIDFHNGLVEIACSNQIDSRGDINLNGIAFEIADWVIFTKYFTNGLSAFQFDQAAQIEASDANDDGYPLTLEDLVYMANYIHGYIAPQNPNGVPVKVEYSQLGTISIDPPLEENLGAFYIVAEGEFTPVLEATQMDMFYTMDSGHTSILITSLDITKSISPGELVTLPVGTDILSIYAASVTARKASIHLNSSQSGRMTVEIDKFEHLDASKPISINVNLTEGGQDIGGFDFLISYDADIMKVTGVTPGGNLIDSCEWEYFTYRIDSAVFDPATGDTLMPGGLLRVVSIADVNDCCHQPTCYLSEVIPTDLFRVNFDLIVDREYINCTYSPIRFYWRDCADNSMAAVDGRKLFIADSILDVLPPYSIYDPNHPDGYPTIHGPQDSDCFIPGTQEPPIKTLTLINGGVDFICIEEPLPRYTIRLENDKQALSSGETFTTEINMDPSPYQIGGFDLLVQYDPNALILQTVKPGQFILDCDWEYFTYRISSNTYCDSMYCITGTVKIVALADLYSQNGTPSCFGSNNFNPSQLAKIHFKVTENTETECGSYPIRFYWEECKNNSLSSKSGEDLFISNRIFDKVLNDSITDSIAPMPQLAFINITNHNDPNGYPTIHGHQYSDCENSSVSWSVLSAVNYFNTLIRINCFPPSFNRGDINYNQIPFEIADWVLFSNYFIFGLEVLNINRAAQILASDVNQDGITLGIDDFVYMAHTITNGFEPPTGDPDSVKFWLTEDGQLAIQSNLREKIGALHLVVEGNITPLLQATQMEMAFDFNGSNTNILLYSSDLSNGIGQEQILTLPGITDIIKIEAATVDARGTKIEVINDFQTGVENPGGSLPSQFSLYQNYPNPFNPSTTISFDLPKAALVEFDIINIMGQTVFQHTKHYSAGQHTIEWNADKHGQPAASGVYYYRIKAGDFNDSRKMILLK